MAKVVTATRLSLNAEEREVRKTWGSKWLRMRAEEKRRGHFHVLFGDWSGYRSSQQRITHIDYIPRIVVEEKKLETVLFSDGTMMRVWTEPFTILELLQKGLRRRQGYTSLIDQAMRSGKRVFDVLREAQ